ncbi:ATP-binding protein [Actinomadura sp. NAK00032]|uniref:ATP-binding protein n=1 Tax=Actinomadura sp. NAK00032 TaxID=2742128 RepID=UPI001590F542|nr:ATP-binding protein [Actinomadura sp. NAK00032]QKW38615.1 ATP-binding protein [Actinomadura sp. NAK00032]
MKHLGTCVIPSARKNVANGRRWLLGRLEPLLGATHSACDDSILLLSETLTNAIVHGTGHLVEVDAYVDTANIRIEVTDEGGNTVPHHRDDPHGEHGRGLPILSMLAKSWGFEQLDDGRLRVWFEVPHTARPENREDGRAKAFEGAPTPPRPRDGTHDGTSLKANTSAHTGDR